MKFPKLNKILILLLTLCFGAVAMFFGRNELGTRNFPFSVLVTADGTQEEIFCLKLGDEFYLFLPSYARQDQAKICTNPIYDVYIDGQKLKNNQSCADFPSNTKLQFDFRSAGNKGTETITIVRSANVATMYIDVPSGNMEYIHGVKGNKEAGVARLYTENGESLFAENLESIQGRGNGTWEMEKKAYSIQFSQETDPLGTGAAKKWILLSNSYDNTHIRNKMSFDLAEAAGAPYSPQSNWVDLYLNGEYAGLYLLSERNEIHPERVSIDAETGFLVAIEPGWRLEQQGYPYVTTEEGRSLRIHNSSMPEDTLLQIFQSAENAIFAQDGYDPVTGKYWEDLIDIDSWARKYLLAEIFVNSDFCLASEYFFYQETDGKIYAGPIWDMDVILGSGSIPWLSDRAILAGRPCLTSETDRNYFYHLLQKPDFYNRMAELYQTEFRPLLAQILDTGIQDYSEKTAQAAEANQVRWTEADAGENIVELQEMLEKRMGFLDQLWIQGKQFHLIQVQQYNRLWAFAVASGEYLDDLPHVQGDVWYRADTDEKLDATMPIQSDLIIYEKRNTP